MKRQLAILSVVTGILPGVCASVEASAEEIRGVASVKSGNELAIGKRALLLFGLAAPEARASCETDEAKLQCGIVAWAELIKLADGQYLSCDIEKAGPNGRVYATCYNGEVDVNETMVRQGWAKAAQKQTDRYIVDEADARQASRGFWGNSGRPSN